VIANAGSGTKFTQTTEAPLCEMRHCFEVNTLGPLKLFQAAWPLLQKSKSPQFVVMSSYLGSIGEAGSAPCAAYGVSKAAVNYLTSKIAKEYPQVIAVAMHPG
jgi:norsolorinic acid ketoreductase